MSGHKAVWKRERNISWVDFTETAAHEHAIIRALAYAEWRQSDSKWGPLSFCQLRLPVMRMNESDFMRVYPNICTSLGITGSHVLFDGSHMMSFAVPKGTEARLMQVARVLVAAEGVVR